jgi:hypothetical protein
MTTSVITPAKLVLVLPEPPSLNQMLDLAKQRTRRAWNGAWMKRSIPIVYDNALKTYELQCAAALRGAGIAPPVTPWPRWSLESAHFQLHRLRDAIELLASLKWPVDVLVRLGYVAGDSPRELVSTPVPTQVIDQRNRRVTLVVVQEPHAHQVFPDPK